MKKKLLIAMLAITSALCCAFGLAACGGKTKKDKTEGGVWGDEYSVKSAYTLAADLGYTGSLEEFIATISGKDGKDGTDGEDGKDGLSAYQIWLNNGHTGTQADFLEWLQGTNGADGEDGINGQDGKDGTDGKDGVGVDKVSIDDEGNLIVKLTDGNTINCGKIKEVGEHEPVEQLQYAAIKAGDEITGYKVTGIGTVSNTDLVIPSTYKGKPVVEIAEQAFSRNNYLMSVVIPDSVTTIGYRAFQGCKSLMQVTLGRGLTAINANPFISCPKLVEIYNLSSFDITAGSGGYNDDYSNIGAYALNVYTSTNEESKLTTTSDGYTFYADGETVYLLDYCGSDINLTLPNDFNGKSYEIYKYAFYVYNTGNNNITSVIIPDGVTEIDEHTFSPCNRMTTVTIPESVTRIRNDAFNSSLIEIYFKGTIEKWNDIEKPYNRYNITVHCTDGDIEYGDIEFGY